MDKNLKFLFLSLSVMLLIVSVGAVSATDVTDNPTVTTDTSTSIDTTITDNNITDEMNTKSSLNKTDNTLKAGTSKTYNINDFGTLHDALTSDAYSTVTVNVKSSIKLTGDTELNEAIKTLTINGNGKTINGNNAYQFLTIDSDSTVTIKNIKIINCYTGYRGYGGAINNQYGTLTITNSTLNNNNAYDGGAIYNGDTLTITNTTLNNNTAEGSGGAIWNTGNLTITNTTLNNNNAYQNGGAINNHEGNLTITNTTLNNNNAYKNGGAIYNGDTLTITNTTLNNNNAYDGGAIYNGDTLTITQSTPNINNAYDRGAIYKGVVFNKWVVSVATVPPSIKQQYSDFMKTSTSFHEDIYQYDAADGNLNGIDSNLTNNNANYDKAKDNYAGDLIIDNSILNNNIAENYGGAIYNRGTLTINNSTLKENKAKDGGAIYNDAGYTIIENNIFIANKAEINGKAIINDGEATISNNTNAETSKYSATIYTSGTNVKIKNNIFYDEIIHIFINSMNVLNSKYVLTTKVTDENYTKLNSGRVSYTLDGKWIGSINVQNGSSWISFNVPDTGNHTIVATYINPNGTSINSDTYTFEKRASTNGVNSLFNAYNVKNGKVIIITNVKYDNGNNVNSGRVSYSLNGKWIGSIDVKNGSSWISFNYNDTVVTFKATFITKNNVTQNIYTRTLNLTELKALVNQNNNTQPLKNSSVHIMINSMNLLNGKYVLTTKVTDKNYVNLTVGRVSYTLNGKWIGSVNVTNGSSWISFDVLGLGNYSVVATYIDKNGKAITTDTFSFEKKSTISGVNAVFNTYNVKDGKVIIITTVKNDKSNPINSGRISYSVNGKWVGSVDVKNGSSWISFNYTNATIIFKATFITNSNVTQNIYTRTLDLDEIARLKQA